MSDVDRQLLEARMYNLATSEFVVALYQEVVRSGAVPRERIREVLRRVPRELTPTDQANTPDPQHRESAAALYSASMDQLGSQILAAVDRARAR